MITHLNKTGQQEQNAVGTMHDALDGKVSGHLTEQHAFLWIAEKRIPWILATRPEIMLHVHVHV